MENRTDKNSYTIIFAIVMVFVVGALLAFTASSLKPRIAENQRIEKQQNILYAMGVNDNTEGSAVLFYHFSANPYNTIFIIVFGCI